MIEKLQKKYDALVKEHISLVKRHEKVLKTSNSNVTLKNYYKSRNSVLYKKNKDLREKNSFIEKVYVEEIKKLQKIFRFWFFKRLLCVFNKDYYFKLINK